jgi:hypothetical protein
MVFLMGVLKLKSDNCNAKSWTEKYVRKLLLFDLCEISVSCILWHE